jgi:hypothetical protein
MTPQYDASNGSDPPFVDEKVTKTLLGFANRMTREGDKTTAKLAKRYAHNLSQRTPELRWATPGSSAIHTRRGFLGRKNPTDAAREEAAKTIEDLTKLVAILQANQAQFVDFGHYLLTETRLRMAGRNYLLPDEIKEYGQLIELISSERLLSTFNDTLEMIETIGKTEITRAMPRQ